MFVCGGTQGLATCWCSALPPVLAVPDAAAKCLCPTCLAKEIEERTRRAASG